MTEAELPPTPFTIDQALAAGFSRRQLYILVHNGRLRSVVTGVYADAATPDSPELLLAAVALVVTPHHVVTDRTAALVHGVDAFAYAGLDTVPDVEMCAFRGAAPTRRQRTFGGSRTLDPDDVMTVGDLRVTTPLRTALDLGCRLRMRDAMAAINALARAHDLTAHELAGELPRYRGRRGVVQLRELVPLVEPRIESPRESWVWLELIRFGLPAPVPQYWIEVDGVPAYRLDFAYPHARVAVEYDGREAHGTVAQREHDERRRAVLRTLGWTDIVVRSGDFTGRRLDDWLRRVRTGISMPVDNRRW